MVCAWHSQALLCARPHWFVWRWVTWAYRSIFFLGQFGSGSMVSIVNEPIGAGDLLHGLGPWLTTMSVSVEEHGATELQVPLLLWGHSQQSLSLVSNFWAIRNSLELHTNIRNSI